MIIEALKAFVLTLAALVAAGWIVYMLILFVKYFIKFIKLFKEPK